MWQIVKKHQIFECLSSLALLATSANESTELRQIQRVQKQDLPEIDDLMCLWINKGVFNLLHGILVWNLARPHVNLVGFQKHTHRLYCAVKIY